MSISIKEVPSLVIPAEVEQEIEPGFYLGPPRGSKGREGLQVRPVLFSSGKGPIIKFFLRTPDIKAVRVGQCTGQDVRDYQEAEGVEIDPFRVDASLDEKDLVLVIGRGSREIFIMRPSSTSCFARLYDSETKEVMTTRGAYGYSSKPSYGYTIELDPSEGLILSADSYINPSSY